jgi:hypothetical protein
MDNDVEALRQAKHLSAGELEALIRSQTPRFLDRLQRLRDMMERGTILRVSRGEPGDSRVIETALMSVVLANVSLLDPVTRHHQTDNIARACQSLGISYQDALHLTVMDQEVLGILTAIN